MKTPFQFHRDRLLNRIFPNEFAVALIAVLVFAAVVVLPIYMGWIGQLLKLHHKLGK